MRQKVVLVSAGTYHLPFNRLSEWMQRWLDDQAGAQVVFQHGPSSPVRGAENVEILPYTELLSLCANADAVVLQGGAGGIMDMRALGITPIVVPRIPDGQEVVDDHQLVFTAEMEKLGIVKRATTFEALADHLRSTLSGSADDRQPPTVTTPGADRVRQLASHPIRKLPWPHRLKRLLRSVFEIVRDRVTRIDR